VSRLKIFSYFTIFSFLALLVLERRGIFIPEVVLAASCESFSSFESGEERKILIELYTSEGCSSCPPAEKWLNSLYADKGLYKDFVPVAFHVDYWDYIGHRDPMASPDFTQRQRAYAREWKASNIYTPEFVKAGKDWRALRRSAPKRSQDKVGNLKVQKKGRDFEVSFSRIGDFELYGALILHGIENKIKRGENRGKSLKHNFVVNELIVKKVKGLAFESFTFKEPKLSHKEKSIVFWVSEVRSQKPIQVAGHCL